MINENQFNANVTPVVTEENPLTVKMIAETLSRIADRLIVKDSKNRKFRREVQSRVKPYLDNEEYGKAIIMYRCLMNPEFLKSTDEYEEKRMNIKSKLAERVDKKIKELKEKGYGEEDMIEIIEKELKEERKQNQKEEKNKAPVETKDMQFIVKIVDADKKRIKEINEQRRVRKYLRKIYAA